MNKIVFTLISADWECRCLHGIFETREEAEQAKEKLANILSSVCASCFRDAYIKERRLGKIYLIEEGPNEEKG